MTTLVVLLVVVILALGTVKEAGRPDVPRWRAFIYAAPNVIGDTIAGLTGTLAFLWIIVTVMIQGSELRLQRRELAMTRRELKAQREASEKMAEAQDEQVKALEAQAEIFRQEARDRAQSETKQLIENIIHRASGLANDIRSRCHWWNKQSYTHRRKGQDTISDTDEEWGLPLHIAIGSMSITANALRVFREDVSSGKITARGGKKSSLSKEVKHLVQMLTPAVEAANDLSGVIQDWYINLNIEEAIAEINELLRMEIWDENGLTMDDYVQ